MTQYKSNRFLPAIATSFIIAITTLISPAVADTLGACVKNNMTMKKRFGALLAAVFFTLHTSSVWAFDPVTITFNATVTNASYIIGETSAGDIGDILPYDINVGDTFTGYFVYDLDNNIDVVPDNPVFGIYEGAAICAGFSANGNTVDIIPPPPSENRNFVNIRDNVNAIPSDQFTMGAAENKLTFLSLPSNDQVVYYDLIDFAVYSISDDPNVNLDILTNDFMQVMPITGWENIQWVWAEYNAETQENLVVQAYTQQFTVAVSTDASSVPAACVPPIDDTDEDGVTDDIDNCPLDFNTDQADLDDDALGDVCDADDDDDGVDDISDSCQISDTHPNVVIDGCDSGVANLVQSNGCTVLDDISTCTVGASNHGKYVSCVSKLTNNLKKLGLITGQQKGAIRSCAAQADIP